MPLILIIVGCSDIADYKGPFQTSRSNVREHSFYARPHGSLASSTEDILQSASFCKLDFDELGRWSTLQPAGTITITVLSPRQCRWAYRQLRHEDTSQRIAIGRLQYRDASSLIYDHWLMTSASNQCCNIENKHALPTHQTYRLGRWLT